MFLKELKFAIKSLTKDALNKLGFLSQEELDIYRQRIAQQENKIKKLQQLIDDAKEKKELLPLFLKITH